MKQEKTCPSCKQELTEENYIANMEQLCNDCYDEQYSGCCGGGCAKND